MEWKNDNYDDEYIRIEEAMRSVTLPLDNAAVVPLAKSSQLIGQAVQDDRWRDVTWQIRGQRVPACTDLWLPLVHLYSKYSAEAGNTLISTLAVRLSSVAHHELITVNRSCDPCDGLIWASFRVSVYTWCVYTHHVAPCKPPFTQQLI